MNIETLSILLVIVIAGLVVAIYYLINNNIKNNNLEGYSSKIDELKLTVDDFKNQHAYQKPVLKNQFMICIPY